MSGTNDAVASAEALARSARLLQAAEDPEIRDKGAELQAWLTDSMGKSLEGALGLAPAPGERSWRNEMARRERDRLLKEASAKFDLQASDLALELSRYFGSSWIRDRNHEVCPDHQKGRLQEFLWGALKMWPRTIGARQIVRLIQT